MAHGLEIDWDTADRITLAVLGHQLKLLREEIRAKDEDGSYMHPEDYTKAKEELIPALKVLIPYYGGDIDGYHSDEFDRETQAFEATDKPQADARDAIAAVREQYRGTDWGKAAECICDAIDAAIAKAEGCGGMSIAHSSDYLPERKITHPELVRLRDGFAKAVLPACYESAIKTLENEGFPEETWRVGVAFDAYQMADAMLVARNIER